MSEIVQIIKSCFSPTPSAYIWLLWVYHWFPAGSIGQWFSDHHPVGKFSVSRRSNVNGRFAWLFMEIIGPVNMLYTMRKLEPSILELPLWNKLTAALYVIHYINRAILQPLFVAPSMSPVGIEIFLIVSAFNWINGAIFGGWIVGYDTKIAGYDVRISGSEPLSGWRMGIPYAGLMLFAFGCINNIRAQLTLWRMRREEAHRRAAKGNKQAQQENIYSKVYVIPPPKGLFTSHLYPHYWYEWIEWFGYTLVGTAVLSSTAFVAHPVTTQELMVAPWHWPLAAIAEKYQIPLPLPALAFLLNCMAAMLPQARRGLRWYKQKFGDKAVAGRSAIVPGVSFL
nr:FunI [Talaromyces coalescens]